MIPKLRVGLTAFVAATLLGVALPSRAGCAPPMLSIDAFQAEAGETITVTGQAWVDGCDDTGGTGGSCASRGNEEQPIANIELRLKGPKTNQTDRMLNSGYVGETEVDVLLAEVAADEQGEFTEQVVLPDVPPGRYFITGIGTLPASQPPQIDIVLPVRSN